MTTVPVPVASLVSAIRHQRNHTHPVGSPGQEAVTAGVSPSPVSRSAELLETAVEHLAAYAGPAMVAPITPLVGDVVYELHLAAGRAVASEGRARTLGEEAYQWQLLAEQAEDLLPVLGVEVVELLHRAVEAEHLAAELTLVVERLAGDQLGDSQVRDRLRRARIRAGEEASVVMAGHFDGWAAL